MSSPLLELKSVSRTYTTGGEPLTVLKEVSLTIQSGEFVAIMGASGSGKSTLMNIIGCLDKPTSGGYSIRGVAVASLNGDALAALRRDTFGFIFQRYNLKSDLNAVENAEVPAVYCGLAKTQRASHASDLLKELGLGDRLKHYPGQLSGGQQQRVSIARALMNGGPVILADEPTGALDSQGGKEVMAILVKLHAQGHTIIVVTHDSDIAAYAHRLVRIADGRITSDELQQKDAVVNQVKLGELERDANAGMAVLGESLKMAFRSLVHNRMRTALTMLGIIIGVASVVALMAIGNGAKQDVVERIQAMGTDLLTIERGPPAVRASGEIVTTEGRTLGRHEGVHHFTVGQRKGLGIATGEPLYVIATDPASQRVTVGANDDLQRARLVAKEVNWISIAGLAPGATLRAEVKIRNKHAAAAATLRATDRADRVEVQFDDPQRAVTPGQGAVFYAGEIVLGGGWIE